MNKTLKIIIAIIAIVLVGWVVYANSNKSKSVVPTQEMNIRGMIENNPVTSFAESVRVTYPNGGEKVVLKKNIDLKWTQKEAGNVNLSFQHVGTKGVFRMLSGFSGVAGENSYRWEVGDVGPNVDLLAGNYTFIVTLDSDMTARDTSDSYFTITAPTPTPVSTTRVTVISPNGGESFKIGESRAIKWNYTSQASKANIVLTPESHRCLDTYTCEFIDRDYSILIELNAAQTTQGMYEWKVEKVKNPKITDEKYTASVCVYNKDPKDWKPECDRSDTYFTITN